MAEQQQGNFVPYTTGGIKPVLYGAQTQVQADQSWGNVDFVGGAIAAQSGNGVFSVDVDGRLRFNFATPVADPYFAQVQLSNLAGEPLLVVYAVERFPTNCRIVIYNPALGEVLVAGLLAQNLQIRTFAMG